MVARAMRKPGVASRWTGSASAAGIAGSAMVRATAYCGCRTIRLPRRTGMAFAPRAALLEVERMTEPQSAATPFGYGAQATTLSGFWRRFVAYVLDAIIVGVVS